MAAHKIDVDPVQIEDLVAANRILAYHGILDAFGHVSIRHPNNPEHYLMSRWLAPALVTADDIAEYDLESVALTHQGMQLYSERYIHSEIYKVRPDVKAIVHSHSPTVVPFSVTKATFRPILHNAAFLGAEVPVFDIRDKFGPTDMLVNRKERGTELAKVLGEQEHRADARARQRGGRHQHPERGVARLLHRGQCAHAGDGDGHRRRSGGVPFAGGSRDHRRIDAAGRGAAVEAVEGKGAGRLIENNGGPRRAQVGETNVENNRGCGFARMRTADDAVARRSPPVTASTG